MKNAISNIIGGIVLVVLGLTQFEILPAEWHTYLVQIKEPITAFAVVLLGFFTGKNQALANEHE